VTLFWRFFFSRQKFTVEGRVGDGDVGHLGRYPEALYSGSSVEAAPIAALAGVGDVNIAQLGPSGKGNFSATTTLPKCGQLKGLSNENEMGIGNINR
jgi:hypothetical protein